MIRRYRLTTKRDAVEPLGVEDARGLKGSGWEGDPGEMEISASAARTSLIIEDLPAPHEPDMPIEAGLLAACVMISATVSATHPRNSGSPFPFRCQATFF